MKKFFIFLLIIFTGLFFSNTASNAVGNYGPNWNKPVIKVYIPEDSYQGMMQRAFQKWSDLSNEKIKFEYLDESPADIEVEFVDKTDGTDGDIGSYTLTVMGGNIQKATIKIAPNPTKNSNNLIYTVMLHEVGHALGLQDTPRKLSIMTTPVSETQDIEKTDILRLFHLNKWSYIEKNNNIPNVAN